MKVVGVIVLAVVAFTCFTGISCHHNDTHHDTEIEPNCGIGNSDIPGKAFVCNNVSQPLCGTDGITYQNECDLCSKKMMSNGELNIKYNGECLPE
ncbi:serine protease inhibitor Kazal-type 6-like isoform X3 [Eleutherodactylus coqui]